MQTANPLPDWAKSLIWTLIALAMTPLAALMGWSAGWIVVKVVPAAAIANLPQIAAAAGVIAHVWKRIV